MTEPKKVRRLKTQAELDREEALASWRVFRDGCARRLKPARDFARAFAFGFRLGFMAQLREGYVRGYLRGKRLVETAEDGE